VKSHLTAIGNGHNFSEGTYCHIYFELNEEYIGVGCLKIKSFHYIFKAITTYMVLVLATEQQIFCHSQS
jgi:hypothetical protein